ncbi:GPI mannosyltransferase 3 [Colletotrichum trifolii]|uniref:Mannosyltransferase n=1 Tax=Colletotrichum trifolii TaxID=5466 RepID=A0A4R8RHJ0_COLTR|nr:GPI mannosyltransferase 3 [Colletotrichum trifolii]
MASVGSPPASELLKAVRNEHNKPSVFRNLVVIRLLNAWWVLTFFQPDEYFQALEPAWRMAFGEGSGAWITWEWQYQLRSSLHPALFAGVYAIADLLARPLPVAAKSWLLLAAPKAVQAVIAATGDWYTWQLAVKLYGADSSTSWFALFMSMFSPFQWYCSTRTFSNSLETTLTIMALNYWPWELLGECRPVKENPKPTQSILHTPGTLHGLRISLLLAAIAILLRPTNILIWATVAVATVTRPLVSPRSVLTPQIILILIREALVCGTLALCLSLASDRFYFGEWAFPPYKWLYFNISQSLAVFYGRNDWHYYLSQGLPLLSITYLPFVLASFYNPPSTASKFRSLAIKTLTASIYVMIASLSLISHKEVRFIYPLLPILHVLAASPLANFYTSPASSPTPQTPLPKPRLRHKNLLTVSLVVHALLSFFLTLLHQPAPLSVLTYLRTSYARLHPTSPVTSPLPSKYSSSVDPLFVLFLTPCHSTPWRSHLHHPSLRARALTCEPPLHTAPNSPERLNYRDEADRFYDDPQTFLATEIWPAAANNVSRYIVGFEGIEPWLHAFFSGPAGERFGANPKRVWQGWNGFFNEDSRRAGRLVVWDTGSYTTRS